MSNYRSGMMFQLPRDGQTDDFPFDFVQNFVRNRSFRRIIYAAGAGSVFFVAWYLYRKYMTRKALEMAGRTAEDGQQLALALYNEQANNNSIVDNQHSDYVMREKLTIEDKVVIHCCPRAYFAPSIATEPLKLETFLRVANIPYEVNFCNAYEQPLLTYGDKSGSTFRECVRILSEQFDVNLESDDVTPSRRTACHLVDISLENHFSWAILIWRWIYDDGNSLSKIHSVNALGEEVAPEVATRVKMATKYNPIGLMDKADYIKTISQGIHDISAALGKHKYYQGQTPGSVDCHAFAILVQIMWNMPGSPFENQIRKYGNLVDYVKRMKEQFWPDWSELIIKPIEFEESYSALSKHRSRGSSKSRKGSKSREHSENDESGEAKPLHGISEENDETVQSENCSAGNSSNKSKLKQSDKGSKLPEPEAVTVLARKDDLESTGKQVKRKFSLKDLDSDPSPVRAAVVPPFSQPTGILKAGTNTSNASVPKPRSGFITASVGSTKFPVDEVNQGSLPALTKVEMNQTKSTPQPQQQARSAPDSIITVNKPTVKFAGAESTSTTIQQPQHQTRQPASSQQQQLHPQSNGNVQSAPTSHIPPRETGNTHPESAAQLTTKRSMEKVYEEQMRHSMQPQSQYLNYVTTQQHTQNLPIPMVQDFNRPATSAPAQHLYNQAQQSASPPSNFEPHSAYQLPLPPLMYNAQAIHARVPPQGYAQQRQYGSPQQQGRTPDSNDGITFGQPSLNPEELQKAAHAHFNAYLQQHHQQLQQQYPHQQPYNTSYNSPDAIHPNYVGQQQIDPRNPESSLLRF